MRSISNCNTSFCFPQNKPMRIIYWLDMIKIEILDHIYWLITYQQDQHPTYLLSLKDDYTSRSSNFLIICFCNFSANCWVDIISLLMAELSHIARVSDPSRVTRKYFIKKFINHRRKSMLKSIIYCNFSNIKCILFLYLPLQSSNWILLSVFVLHFKQYDKIVL